MEGKYILALDQGTTSSRAIVFDKQGNIVSIAQKDFRQIYPKPGWVEQNPNEIWSTQAGVAAEATVKEGLNGKNIAAIGITNQRETTIVWDRKTSRPIYNAIVWQDNRTAAYCESLTKECNQTIQAKTGLVVNSYFSATKIKWILDNVAEARKKAEAGALAFGTVDTWIVWRLTRGEVHVTDVSNASRTMLFNIRTLQWDEELLRLFQIPRNMLPEVRKSSELYGTTKTTIFASKIPIAGIAGDQQAALFGQCCTKVGMVKNTYGTGSFMLMHTGNKPFISKHNLLTTIACKYNEDTEYALEGSTFISGSLIQWLKNELGIIKSSKEAEQLAKQVTSTEGVYFVPAFAGLGAPYWDQHARGTIFGITRGTKAAHIARAALEGIAYQTMDVLRAMEADSDIKIKELRVDGGASVNETLMQFQSDLLNTIVIRAKITETTALGAAYLAGLAVGYWEDLQQVQKLGEVGKVYKPQANLQEQIKFGVKEWERAVKAVQFWSQSD